jgi:2-polyprenyl-3-methyl-5-hydroxy-6-metoxy-1,4-benzoquinol methylase
MSDHTTQPSPQLIFDTITAYQQTGAIKAAIEVDIFTAIGRGNHTANAIATTVGAAERGVRILCDYLTVIGFLTKQDSNYHLTQDSAIFLDKRSPAYLGSMIEFLLTADLTEAFSNLTAAVRKGGTLLGEHGTVSTENPVWVNFARGMASMAVMPGQAIVALSRTEGASNLRVLDIAAGHGMYGIAFARQNPTAEVTALDWEPVLEVAKENAKAAGVLDRFKTIPGSAFDADFGSGYDIVLLTNFLHHFDPATCETLLRKVHAALAPGGRAMTLEFVPNGDRVSPPNAAMFSLVMLATTPSGDAYTFGELDSMFEKAGFARSELVELPASIQRLVISYK